MNPTIILTIERGCLVAATTTGGTDILVHDRDIHFLPAAVERVTPEIITLAEMSARLEALNQLSPSINHQPSTIH